MVSSAGRSSRHLRGSSCTSDPIQFVAMRAEIEKRINGAGFVPVSQIVQETYLKEVIDLAATASKGRSEHEALTRLRKLVEVLDAFEVRNAVCHPNRPFPECYWHRMAALATDPAIEQLRLRKVTDAFRCAIEHRLTPPPDGWLQQQSWNVPNNLPTTFDHHVTGLIARQDEARDLRRRLQNLRNSLVAIVGPGGTGKTALCLEVLRDCVLDPERLSNGLTRSFTSPLRPNASRRGESNQLLTL